MRPDFLGHLRMLGGRSLLTLLEMTAQLLHQLLLQRLPL
jgi:hypothetical protein